MANYATLHELIQNDPESKKLFDSFAPDTQVALEEIRQDIHSYQELRAFAAGLEKR